MGMAENNIEWGARREIEFNIKSNLNKKLLFRQAVLYTFGQDCSYGTYGFKHKPASSKTVMVVERMEWFVYRCDSSP